MEEQTPTHIYLRDGEMAASLEDLMNNCFITDDTLNSMGYMQSHKCKETYLNPECTELQCKGARRSFGDLLILARTYFPETTEEQLAKLLHEFFLKRQIRALYCHNISRIVFCRGSHDMFIDRRLEQAYPLSLPDMDMYTAEYIENLINN
jgi:hypothetical protein